MRLYSYRDEDWGLRLGLIEGARLVPLPGYDLRNQLQLDEWREELHRSASQLSGAAGRSIAEVDPRPAVDPGKVVCVGLNYRDHVTEGAGREVPERPLLFAKFAHAVIANGEPIVRPEGTRALDLEVELGVVIGRTAKRVPVERAMDHVAGYIVVNDVSARDWQGSKPALRAGEKGDGQWLRAKGSDTFLPMGPVFVTADELDPAAGLRLRSWRIPAGSDEPILMQEGSTADLIWSIPELIEFITGSITLDPGDVIATGTPAGVGVFRDPPVFLEPGDRVRCEIEGIGSVENPVIDWSEAAAEG